MQLLITTIPTLQRAAKAVNLRGRRLLDSAFDKKKLLLDRLLLLLPVLASRDLSADELSLIRVHRLSS